MSGNGVCGVDGSRPRYFSPEEEEALRKDESTSALTNQGRRNAGMKEADVPIRGDDKTLDYVLHHPHVALGEAIGAAFHGAELGEVLIGGKVAAAVHALGRAGVVAPPVVAFHPDAKQRYDADAAYRYGFDALVWSKSQADGGAAYEQQIKALRDRDGWYAQSCIQIRP
ncbi:MAG: hypothetical protein JST00_32650 [Deltaproteobacteria bacterium]|nr:hypothetical protein [Deltaproteobacteria bacterium]